MQLNEIRDSYISLLINIGQSLIAGELPSASDLASIRPHDRINRLHFRFWNQRLLAYSINDLNALILGLVYTEERYRWSGGSGASSIGIFTLLVNRGASLELLDEISDWVINNTRNQYLPFGGRRSHCAKNYSDYLEKSAAYNKSREDFDLATNAIEEEANKEREKRREMAATGRLARQSSERVDEIRKLEFLPITEQLRIIAFHPKYPPQFFPTCIAGSSTDEVLTDLSKDVQIELARRL